VTWTAMSSVFPHGLDYLYNVTGWPVQGHNRYWSPQSPYAKQNGGPWNFVVETAANSTTNKHLALPLDQARESSHVSGSHDLRVDLRDSGTGY
jgi:hypothetical protein